MMERDPDIVVLGEDVGYFGGVFRVTEGSRRSSARPLLRRADQRGGIVGDRGRHGRLRPEAGREIQFADYIYPGYDQIVSEAPMRYRTAGEWTAADGDPLALWRRHLRRPDAQPVARGLFTHVAGSRR
jgi:2-oxoisovalerate dehydrogenase E1 component beta subunit